MDGLPLWTNSRGSCDSSTGKGRTDKPSPICRPIARVTSESDSGDSEVPGEVPGDIELPRDDDVSGDDELRGWATRKGSTRLWLSTLFFDGRTTVLPRFFSFAA